MTYGEMKKSEKMISVEDVLDMSKKLIDKFDPEFNPEIMYPHIENAEVMPSGHRCSMYVGNMVSLFRRAYYLGGSHQDLLRIAKHIMVLIDSIKKHLNFRQSEIDNNIKDLISKFDKQSFMFLDYSIVERAIKHHEDCRSWL